MEIQAMKGILQKTDIRYYLGKYSIYLVYYCLFIILSNKIMFWIFQNNSETIEVVSFVLGISIGLILQLIGIVKLDGISYNNGK